MIQENSQTKNVRPFDDIPEVGYSLRHPSWLMLLAEEKDGMSPILAEVEAFTVSRRGTADALRGGLSEHTVYNLIAAGIRIGERRRLLAEGVLEKESK